MTTRSAKRTTPPGSHGIGLCQCEHESHWGPFEHQYALADAEHRIKTIYGTLDMCKHCAAHHLRPQDIVETIR